MNPTQIIDKMYAQDYFSIWMDIKRIEEGYGFCTLEMTIRKEMLNGFGVCHGGIPFSFADSALAFACNSHGRHAVSIDNSINHVAPIREGDVITAKAIERVRKNKLAWYDIDVTNQKGEIVALFKGMVFIKESEWE